MYQPEIISEEREESSARLQLRVSPELAFFPVHFPEWPILPGVVQVHWAIGIARRLFGVPGKFRGMDNLKFHRVVRPNTDLELTLRFDAQLGRLDFTFAGGSTKYSSGRVLFGAPS